MVLALEFDSFYFYFCFFQLVMTYIRLAFGLEHGQNSQFCAPRVTWRRIDADRNNVANTTR